MTAPPPPALADLAAVLEELADWIDGELAGGQPPKHVARTAAGAVRWIAAGLKGETS